MPGVNICVHEQDTGDAIIRDDCHEIIIIGEPIQHLCVETSICVNNIPYNQILMRNIGIHSNTTMIRHFLFTMLCLIMRKLLL